MYSKCRGCTTMTASWSSNTHNTQRQTACGLFIFLSIDATTTCLNFFVNLFLHMYLLTSSADMVLCYIISSLVRIWYNIKPYPHCWSTNAQFWMFQFVFLHLYLIRKKFAQKVNALREIKKTNHLLHNGPAWGSTKITNFDLTRLELIFWSL